MITLLAHHLYTTHTIPTAEKKMALTSSLTTTRPLANKISSRLTPIIKSQKTHLSNPTYFFNFPQISTQFKFKSTTTMPLVSSRKFYSKVRVSAAGEEAYQEDFNWSSVILPFVFPALGGLLFGYDIGATSSATLSLQSAELSGTTWFNLSAVQLGLVVSGSLYGALFGSILVYPIADFLGRKRELLLAALLYLLGGSVTAYAPGLNVLLLGRVLYGLGIGLAMHGAPLYIAETCPSQIRGTLISLKELFIVLGIFLGYFVGSFQIDAVGGWRYMFGFSAPVALLMGLGVWSLPESPRWLLLRAVQGKASLQEYKEKAIVAYSKLRGRPAGDKVSEKQIEDTLVSLKTASGSDQESEGSIFEVFQGPSLKAFVIGGGLVLFQQITGQPSVLYYAGQILQTAGFSAAADATRVSVVIGVFKLLMTSIAILKVDDLGRKPLLIGGISGITISLLLLTAYYKFLGGFPLVAVGALLLYVGCYQISFGPISWLMVSEIFPSRTRGKGVSLAVLTNFGSNALVTFAFSPLKELLGAENLFLLFAAIALLSLGFVLLYVPETKGLSLEEIESKLSKNKTPCFCKFLAMTQPDNTQRMTIADASNALRSQNSSGSKASTTQTSPHSQHLQGGSSSWSSDSLPKSKKKSVFTKVKEKAKKLKKSLSKRKHRGDNDLHTSCTTSVVEDDEKEQSEYFGSPLYEPTVAPGTDKRSLEESSLEEMQPHDKGVSVTEYLMHKFEPGEDERALSQVITQTIRCKKMKEAMNSLLGNEEPSDSISKNTNLEPDTAPSSSSWFSQQEGAFHD